MGFGINDNDWIDPPVSALKSTKCRDCPHCRHWRVDVGGASVEAGFCPWQDVPLSHADLEASVWDACGNVEGAV